MVSYYSKSTLYKSLISLVIILAIVNTIDNRAIGQSADLDQVRNGSASNPNNPAVWVNGNAGASNSHYVEGHSIPYRCVMTQMPVGTSVTITFGYDTKHSDGHALDYLTQYNRLLPHAFAHGTTVEVIDPISGLGLNSPTVSTYAFPVPTGINGPVPNQPQTSFSSLPASERVMTIYNGTITNISYVLQDPLNTSISESQINVTFTPSASTVVLTWGGHIASRVDWGYNPDGTARSAAGISGSPYHMRLVSWTLGSLGNTDRSLSAAAVLIPPSCAISGNSSVCANTTQSYSAASDGQNSSFLWSITGNASISGSNTGQNVSVLAGGSGSYTLSVEISSGGLTSTCSKVVTVNSASCSISGETEICVGQSTTLTASSGMNSYLWSTGATTQSITVSSGGVYSVSTINSSGCSATCNTTVNQPSQALSASCSKSDVLCFGGSTGSASVVASGGTAPYSYSWSNGSTSATTSGLIAGSYSVTVTDSKGCTASCSATVSQTKAGLSASCSKTDVLCFGGNTGSASVIAAGGTAPYSFSWSNGSTSASANGLIAGSYSVIVTDGNGCTASCSVNVGQPAAALSASCSKSDVLCFGGNTGSASVEASGGTAPYSYSWSNGSSSSSANGLIAGSYSVIVTDGNGCTSSCSVTVGQPSQALSASCSKSDVLCFGGNTGSASVVASGGTAPYSYSWSNGSTSASANGLIAGSYSVTVTDAKGCTASCSATVGQPAAALSAVCSKTDAGCFGASTGSVNVVASGGSAPYTYVWNTGATTASLSNKPAGVYSVTVTDSHGCTTTCSSTIGQPAAALSGNVTSTVATCTESNAVSTAHISGGTQPYSYAWSNGQSGESAQGYAAGSYSVQVTDAHGCQLSLSFTVAKTNCPPVANDDYATTLESSPVTIVVVSNDTDVDGNIDPSTVTQISSPSNGTVVLNPNGTFTYTPNPNYVGNDQFNYQVCDDGTPLPIQCDQATVFITVTGVPTTIIDSIPEDSLITICMEDFVNLQGGISSISICGMPQNGTFTISGTCVTYTPTANWNGTDEMCIISCNANNVCDTTPITIIVIPVNDPPVANDDNETTQEDVPVTVTVVTNDTDIDGNIDPTTVTVVSQPSNGTVVVNPNGTITYTPSSHFVGSDQFNYQVCDDGTPLPALCDIATVFITVTGLPTTIIDSIPEDSLITICMEDFVNLQGGISSISICGMPANGTFTVNGTCVTYTPTANWNGTDEMCVISCNANNVCDTTPITIIVIPVNDPPVANDDNASTNEDVPVTVVVVTNDTDIDGNIDPNTVTIITPPTNGTAVVNPDGSITYTPDSHFYGQDSLVYQVCDDGTPLPSLCDQATVYINVVPVNLPPVAIDDINNTLINTPVSGNVLTNDSDPDGDSFTVTANTNPLNGTIVINPDGSYSYTPNNGYTGEDTFTYTICDNGVPGPLCDVATVTIHIISVTTENNPPVANPDNAVTLVNVPVGGNVLVNDGDPDGDNIILNTTPVSNPTNGSVVLNPDGSYIYTPNNSFVGVDVFTYEICDDGVPSLCDQTTVTITVLDNPNGPDNDPPFAADDAYLTPVNTPVSGDMLANDFDPNGDPIAVNITPVSNPAHGSVVINSDGTFTYTPNSGYIGPDQFVYEICDNGGQSGQVLCAQGTVYITVYPVIDITVVADNASCFGYSDGAVNLTVIGGVAPFTYAWSNGATTEDLSGVVAGTYSVTVTDAFGLVLLGSATVGQPAQVILSVDANGPTEFCAGGSVTLTANSTSQGIYLWSNGATTQSIVVAESGNYSVVLTDGTGCSGTSAPISVTVFENPVPVISADGPTEFCDGGSVVLTASEAAMYVWSPGGETTQSISLFASGSYTVWVMDSNGCEGTSAPVAVTVYQNPVPVISADGPTTFCSGESVTLTSSEAVSYLWAPTGETTQSIVVSASGIYTVVVIDVNGCRGSSAPAEVVVNSNPVPQVSADGPLTFCEGGSVTLTSSEVAGNVWSPNGQTTQSIVVSSAGSYFVTVTDENGCVGISNPVEVFVNPNPVPVVTADGPLTFCAGETVTLTSSEAATYVWSPGGELTQSITVSASGDYSVWVIDANGCEGTSAPVSVVVNNNPAPVVSANGPTQFCMGGSVVLTATDAASYVWSPSGETTQSITVAEAGTYYVTVTDANGCVGVSNPVAVTVNPNPVPEISADGPTTFCAGGQVALIASEAASYVWTPNGETSQTIIVSASGTYSVAVIDINGCSGVSSAIDVVVNSNPVPVISANGPTSFCQGNSVTFTSSEAASYLWSPTGETTQSVTVTNAGDYNVTVIDENGCSGTSAPVTVTIITPPTPVVSVDGPSTFCAGESVILTSTSATGNVWSPNGETTQSIVVSAAGSYYVTVTANGCVGVSAPVDVVVNPNPTPVVSSDGPLTFCQGGSVTLSSSPAASYLWSPNGETTQSITVSDAGSYYVIVFDENGCRGVSAPVAVVINSNPAPEITANGPTTFCEGGSVTLTSSSASGYSWSNGATTQSITVTSTGDYKVTVIDVNGCSGSSDIIHVDVNSAMTVSVTANGPVEFCEGQSVTLTATASNAASYQWYQNGDAMLGGNSSSIIVTSSGSYSVVATTENGCAGTSSVTIVHVGVEPTAYAGMDEMICPGASVTLTATGGENFLWSNGATTQSITVSPEEATDYIVSVSNNFCSQVATDTINVNVAELPVAAIHASDNPSLGNPVNFTDVSGDNSIVSWFWDFGDGNSSATQNTHHTYDFEDVFTVILTVENQYGCSASDTVEVEVQQVIIIPNIITPNNDGFNDALGVKNNGVDDYSITIFNRWGQIVYEREAREINWDGRTNSGVALEEGTYFYILKVNNPNGSMGSWEQTGFITLLR